MAILEAKKTVLYAKSGADRVPLYPKTSADHVIATDKSGADSTVQAELEALRSDISTLQELSFSYKGKAAAETDLTDYSAGDYWIVGTAGTYGGNTCEVGDVLVCTQSTGAIADDFIVLQANLVTAVQTSSTSTTAGHIAVYDSADGLKITDSGKTLDDLAQNAFQTVNAGDTAITAASPSAALNVAAGDGITVTGAADTNTVTIAESYVDVVTVSSLDDVPSNLREGGLIILSTTE